MSESLIMLDTNTVSYLIRDKNAGIQKHLAHVGIGHVCISTITEAELRFGLRQRPAAAALIKLVDNFFTRVDSLPWDSEAARSYAELRAHCKAHGYALSNMDMLIGAHSMAVNATLVTNDKAFLHLTEKLTLDNWIDE